MLSPNSDSSPMSMRKINLIFGIIEFAIMSAFITYLLFLFHNDARSFNGIVALASAATDLVRDVYPKISMYETELATNGYEERVSLVITAYSVCFAFSALTFLLKLVFFRQQLTMHLKVGKEIRKIFKNHPVSMEISFIFSFFAVFYFAVFSSIDFQGDHRFLSDQVHLYDTHLYLAALLVAAMFGMLESLILEIVAKNRFLSSLVLKRHSRT